MDESIGEPVNQQIRPPTLYIFAGLPGAGKSTLAKMLASCTGATYLRIDTVEQGLRDLCGCNVQGEGYRLSYRLADDNLRLGTSVVADSCNPWELTRREWRAVAIAAGAEYVDIEVVCHDKQEHRRRVEGRSSEIANLRLPTWQDVLDRRYEPWSRSRVVLDTAGGGPDDAFRRLVQALGLGAEETDSEGSARSWTP